MIYLMTYQHMYCQTAMKFVLSLTVYWKRSFFHVGSVSWYFVGAKTITSTALIWNNSPMTLLYQWMAIQSIMSFTNASAAKVFFSWRFEFAMLIWCLWILLFTTCRCQVRNAPHQRMGVTGVFKSNLGQGASTRGASRRWLGTNMFEIWLWMMDYKKIAGYIHTHTNQYNPVYITKE